MGLRGENRDGRQGLSALRRRVSSARRKTANRRQPYDDASDSDRVDEPSRVRREEAHCHPEQQQPQSDAKDDP